MTFNETKEGCLTLVEDSQIAIPDGVVKNLATSISYDQDFIILGDAYTNADENQRQKQDADKIHIIKYTKNNLPAYIVSAHSMSRHLNYDKTDFLKRLDFEG